MLSLRSKRLAASGRQAVGLPLVGLLLSVQLLAGCGGASLFAEPTATPLPTATPTPLPTPTLAPGATPAPMPQVTIPQGFTVVQDAQLRYSFAVPSGWNELDLQGGQVQTMAGFLGMGEQLTQLNEFLASPEGQFFGKLYLTDLTAVMFGGLPTLLNVSVVAAPGLSAENAASQVQQLIEQNMGALGGDVTIGAVEVVTVNNLPAIRSTATANLAPVGIENSIFGKVVALLANDQIYIMTLMTPLDQRTAKEPTFDQIIGTFRPE